MKKNHIYKKLGFFFTIALSATLSLEGAGRTVPVPGIDAIPLAPSDGTHLIPLDGSDSGEKKKKEEKKDSTSTPAAPEQARPNEQRAASEEKKEPPPTGEAEARGNGKSSYPLISDIAIKSSDRFPDSVDIQWKNSPSNDTVIFIVRDERPINTRDRLFNALNVTTPPLGPRETTFTDVDLPQGTYYYAVVTSLEISSRGELHLKPDVNYTSRPVVVTRDKKSAQSSKENRQQQEPIKEVAKEELEVPMTVTGLTASTVEKSVLLEWQPVGRSSVEYRVYRSDSPLDSEIAVRRADRLGTLKQNQLRFEDTSPISDKRVYYGVAVFDPATGKEKHPLRSGESYIEYKFFSARDGTHPDLPQHFFARAASDNSIVLIWRDSAERVAGYQIYRAPRLLNSRLALSFAKKLGAVTPAIQTYHDESLPPGNYYYALIPLNEKGDEIQEFVEERTYTVTPVTLQEKKETSSEKTQAPPATTDQTKTDISISNLIARDEREGVRLSWLDSVDGAAHIVYRIPAGQGNKASLTDAETLGNTAAGENSFVDTDPARGKPVFYFVSSIDPETKVEKKVLQQNKTYVFHIARAEKKSEDGEKTRGVAENRDLLLPSSLIGMQESANSAKIIWADPISSVRDLALYRSSVPIIAEPYLERAKLIAVVKPGKGDYSDSSLPPGTYYYGLFPRTREGILHEFVAGRTFTGSPVTIEEPKEEPRIETKKEQTPQDTITRTPVPQHEEQEEADILYFNGGFDGEGVILSWGLDSQPEGGLKLYLYRSQHSLSTTQSISRHGKLVGSFDADSSGYREEGLEPGYYHYALLLKRDGKLKLPLLKGKNFLPGPIFVRKPIQPPVYEETGEGDKEKSSPAAMENKEEDAQKSDTPPEDTVHEPAKDDDTSEESAEKEDPQKSPWYGDGDRVEETPSDTGRYMPPEVREARRKHNAAMDQINDVIAATFMKKRYSRAVESLAYFVSDRKLTDEERARAMLYMGLSYFRMKQFRKAMVIFMTPELRKAYPDRWRFWYEQSRSRVR